MKIKKVFSSRTIPILMKICVIGQGYIGIPTAMVLANENFEVIGIDKNPDKIDLLQNHRLPFHEKEFTEFATKIFSRGNYSASTEIPPADVFIICVPTPFTSEKQCDYKYINAALADIQSVIQAGNLIILESTVPPKTCQEIIIPQLEHTGLKAGQDFYVSHAPERLLPGNILHEIIYNDRIIGGIDEKSTQMTYDIYKTFCKGEILLTDATTAEMSKCTENTFRDVNIALANELAKICEELDIDPYQLIELANHHPRVNILTPGPGVGGHCIPIDPWFIVEKAPATAKLIHQARLINDSMPKYVIRHVKTMVEDVAKPIVTVLGAAYKPNVDDPRESPTQYIVQEGIRLGWEMRVHDPLIKNFKYPLFSLENAIMNSDCIIYVMNHEVFQKLDISQIKKNVRHKNVFLCGNFGYPRQWEEHGFKVRILGKKKII